MILQYLFSVQPVNKLSLGTDHWEGWTIFKNNSCVAETTAWKKIVQGKPWGLNEQVLSDTQMLCLTWKEVLRKPFIGHQKNLHYLKVRKIFHVPENYLIPPHPPPQYELYSAQIRSQGLFSSRTPGGGRKKDPGDKVVFSAK